MHDGLACLRRPNDQGVPKPDHLHGHAAPIFVADDDVACLRDVARLQLAPLPDHVVLPEEAFELDGLHERREQFVPTPLCVPNTLNPTIVVMKSAQDGSERMTPARCTKRETGASLFNDRCFLMSL